MRIARHPGLAMTNLTLLLVWAFAGSLAFPVSGYPESPDQSDSHLQTQTYAFINGRWFTGQEFLSKPMYSVNGVFTHSQPDRIGKTIDLKNGFVIPPFGEAHTHNVEGEWNIDQVIEHYLRDGIFYVKNPNDIPEFVEKIRHKLNKPEAIDVVFAHAGLTGPHGHPIALYEEVLRLHRYEPVIGKREKSWFNGRAYFPISTLKDLEDHWPAIRATKPDFLKVYLAGSEHFRNTAQVNQHGFRKGLDPQLIGPIVAFAHQQGLRVSAHVETAADFRTALKGDVDEIAHVPGWFLPTPSQRSAVHLTQDDAQLAAKHQAVIVTTTVAGHFHTPGQHHPDPDRHLHPSASHGDHHPSSDEAIREEARKIQANNLTLLHQAGVKIAIGSDHAETALDEALHLHHLGVFDNLTLLKMWCETTPQTIFPFRKIGRFEEGYEASFLVLQQNPLEDFRHVRTIHFRFKQGFPLSVNHVSHADSNRKNSHWLSADSWKTQSNDLWSEDIKVPSRVVKKQITK